MCVPLSYPVYICSKYTFLLQDLLSLTPLEVMRVAGQSHYQSLQLLKSVSLACAPKIIPVGEVGDEFVSSIPPRFDVEYSA